MSTDKTKVENMKKKIEAVKKNKKVAEELLKNSGIYTAKGNLKTAYK